jgi:hypothetical protein
MNVWFGTTTSEFDEYKDVYFHIREVILQNKCHLVFDWLDDANETMKYRKGKDRKIKEIYENVVRAMQQANISIIEYTVPNFSSSHQINYGIYNKKPTLVLRQSPENKYFKDSYLDAVKSPYLFIENYRSKEELKGVIERFISKIRKDYEQNRYNVILDSANDHFLTWASAKYKKSRSEIIRESLYKLASQHPEYPD